MPARITVRAELQSLLNKSQALTDANRLAQLDAERRRREELAQLAAKREKVRVEATRRKQIEDPAGRTRRTAAMGQPGGIKVSKGFVSFYSSLGNSASFPNDSVAIWSGNGLSRVDVLFGESTGGTGIAFPVGGFAGMWGFVYGTTSGGVLPITVYFDHQTARVVTPPPGFLDVDLSYLGLPIGYDPALFPSDPRIVFGTDAAQFAYYASVFPDLHAAPITDGSYAFWRSVYAPVAPGLRSIVAFDNASENPSGSYTNITSPGGFEWQGADPSEGFTPAPFTDPLWRPIKIQDGGPGVVPLRPNETGDGADPSLRAERILTYDWQRPAFCREALLAIGFAPEDLQP